jgi:ATP-dependent DNA ligase
MLASAYEKSLVERVSFPAVVQKKMDGMRFAAIVKDGDVQYFSRNGRPVLAPPEPPDDLCKSLILQKF